MGIFDYLSDNEPPEDRALHAIQSDLDSLKSFLRQSAIAAMAVGVMASGDASANPTADDMTRTADAIETVDEAAVKQTILAQQVNQDDDVETLEDLRELGDKIKDDTELGEDHDEDLREYAAYTEALIQLFSDLEKRIEEKVENDEHREAKKTLLSIRETLGLMHDNISRVLQSFAASDEAPPTVLEETQHVLNELNSDVERELRYVHNKQRQEHNAQEALASIVEELTGKYSGVDDLDITTTTKPDGATIEQAKEVTVSVTAEEDGVDEDEADHIIEIIKRATGLAGDESTEHDREHGTWTKKLTVTFDK